MDVVVHTDFSQSSVPKELLKGHGHAYLNVLKCLGYRENAYPVADWLRLYHRLEGRWLVVTPIYWQASHNDVLLMACDRALDCSDADARMAFEVFSAFAAEEGMQVHYHDPYTWLLQCEHQPVLTALPPYDLMHQSMFPHIQQLDSTLAWSRFLTEVQMLFAQCLSRSCIINGVWIWGEGQLDKSSNRMICVHHQAQFEMAGLLSNQTQFIGQDGENAPHLKASIKEWLLQHRVNAKHALFWFDSLSRDEHEILSLQLRPYAVNWYWNNLAYHTKKASWFTKIFSSQS